MVKFYFKNYRKSCSWQR